MLAAIMHWLSVFSSSVPLLSLAVLTFSLHASSQSTRPQGSGQGVAPLVYNDNYAPEILDLLTEGILKYGLFGKEVAKHPKLQQRLDSTVKGLRLDVGVGLRRKTVKLDLGLGPSQSKKKARSARHAEQASHHRAHKRYSSSFSTSAGSPKEKRLLGLGPDSTTLFGRGQSDPSNDKSLRSIELGVQTVVDDGWNDAVTTRLMNSQNDNAWFANISFGTPSQYLSMFIDSGSADVTVFDPACTTCGLETRTPFDNSSSTSYTSANAAFSTGYGDGTTMSGFLGKDIVGLSPGLSTSAHQLLGIITSQVKGSGARLYDGILGIGPDQLSFVENNVTPFSRLVKENKITRPLLGIALVKKGTVGHPQGGGEYRWGSLNTSYICGPVIYSPVTSNFYWGVDVPGIYVYGIQMYGSTEPRRAIVDTGTTLVYVSTAVAQQIHSRIPGSSFNLIEGAWYVPCSVSDLPRVGNPNGDPNVFFEIGGHRWGVPVQDLAFRASGRNDGLCISGIQGGSDSFAVLGDVFIKNRYLVLSYGNNQQTALQVGLANRTDIPPIL